MNVPDIAIGSVRLGLQRPPAVVAEIGANHDGSLEKATELIEVAAESGAAAVKFQLFHPDDLYAPGTREHGILSQLALPRDWLPQLKATADRVGVEFLASSFCSGCVRDLDEVGVPGHKVASSEVTKLDLVLQIARSGKPVLLSTGMSDLSDVARAVEVCQAAGNSKIVVMQCTSLYPTPPPQTHLRAMGAMGSAFGHLVGFSDHTLGSAAAVAAVALGARVIEKHVTLSRSSKGPDHSFAVEPAELQRLCEEVAQAYAALGSATKRFLEDERHATRRAGLYAARDIEHGETLSPEAIVARRPAAGITVEFRDAVAAATAAAHIREGAPLRWRDLE